MATQSGYAANLIPQLPINTIKIDKSFVQQITNNHSDAVIVHSIIELGHNLGFDVVAEGIETNEAYKVLRQPNCDIAPGYFISKAMSETQFTTGWFDAHWTVGWP